MKKELKPCPFCGHKAELWEDMAGSWLIQCNGCGISTMHRWSQKMCIEEWNRRVSDGED